MVGGCHLGYPGRTAKPLLFLNILPDPGVHTTTRAVCNACGTYQRSFLHARPVAALLYYIFTAVIRSSDLFA